MSDLQEEIREFGKAQAQFKSELTGLQTIVLNMNSTLIGGKENVLTRLAVLEDRSITSKETKRGERAIILAVGTGALGLIGSILSLILKHAP